MAVGITCSANTYADSTNAIKQNTSPPSIDYQNAIITSVVHYGWGGAGVGIKPDPCNAGYIQSVDGNGNYTKECGRLTVETCQLPVSNVKDIIDASYQNGFFSLNESYDAHVSDSNFASATIAVNNSIKKVETSGVDVNQVNYINNALNKAVTEIENNNNQVKYKCTDRTADTDYLIDYWLQSGNISPELAANLKSISNGKLSESEYEIALGKLKDTNYLYTKKSYGEFYLAPVTILEEVYANKLKHLQ